MKEKRLKLLSHALEYINTRDNNKIFGYQILHHLEEKDSIKKEWWTVKEKIWTPIGMKCKWAPVQEH